MIEYAAKAAEILYNCYLKFKGLTPQEICEHTNAIYITSYDLLPGHGVCIPNRHSDLYLIIISAMEDKVRSSFIAYHELAHAFLLRSRIPNPSREEYWTLDAWCDNFSLAMCLAHFGINAVTSENAHEFFIGNEEIRDEQDCSAAVAKRFNASISGHEITSELQEFCDTFKKTSS